MIRFAFLFSSSAALLKGLSFFVSLWLAHALIKSEYATWGLALAVQSAIATFSCVGLQESIVALLRKNSGCVEKPMLQCAALRAFTITVTITLIFSTIAYFTILEEKNINLYGFLGVVITGLLLSLCTLQAQMYRLEEEHKNSLVFSFIIPLSGVLGSIVFFAYQKSISSFYLGSGLFMMLLCLFYCKSFLGFSNSSDQVSFLCRCILKRLLPFVLIAFFGWLSGFGSTFIVNHMFSTSEVAKLTFILTVGSGLQLLITAFNQVWAPRFFNLINLQKSSDEIEILNRRFFNILALGLGVIAAIVILGIPYLLNFFGGELIKYHNTKFEILMVFSGYIFLIPWTHCQNYLLVYDKGKSLMYIVLLTSVLGLITSLLLMNFLGNMGIYIGFFIQMVLRSIGISVLTKKWLVKPCWLSAFGGTLIAYTGFYYS